MEETARAAGRALVERAYKLFRINGRKVVLWNTLDHNRFTSRDIKYDVAVKSLPAIIARAQL